MQQNYIICNFRHITHYSHHLNATEKRTRVSNDCKQRSNPARKRLKRDNESDQQRELRLERNRSANATSRSKKWDGLTRIAFNYQVSTGNYDHPSLHINSMINVCTFCKAKRFEDETLGNCCSGGKVILEPFPAPLLQELFCGVSPMSKQFLAKII